jgi:hypothetical protein
MSQKIAGYPTPDPDKLSAPITRTLATYRLVRHIEVAHESGVLFFLAAQLRPLLEEFGKKNGPSTSAELETLIVKAARAMIDE